MKNAKAQIALIVFELAVGLGGSWLFSEYGAPYLEAIYPAAVLLWPIVVVLLGIAVGWQIRGWQVRKKLGMAIDEAAERLDRQAAEERAAEECYSELCGLPLRSKRIIYDGWVGYGLWDGDVSRNREVLLLADMGFMRELPAEDGEPRTWAISKEVMDLLNTDDDLLDDFQGAALQAARLEPDPIVPPEQAERYIEDFEDLSLERKIDVFKLLMWEDEPGSYDDLGWMDGLSFVDLEEVAPGTFAAECKPGARELFKERDEVTVNGVPMCGVLMRVRDYLGDYRPIDPDPEPDIEVPEAAEAAEVA